MTIDEVLAYVRGREKDLTLVNPPPESGLREQSEDFFAHLNVRVRSVRTASGRPSVAVLAHDRDLLAIVPNGDLERLVSREALDSALGIDDREFSALLRPLKETTFRSFETRDMLAASREIEDRAHRVGAGTLRSGFQHLSRYLEQRQRYAALADGGVTTHVYGVPDVEIAGHSGVLIHESTAAVVAYHWFVVYDGGGDDQQKSALVAEQTDDGGFDGFWTYDPGIVDRAMATIESLDASGSRTGKGAHHHN